MRTKIEALNTMSHMLHWPWRAFALASAVMLATMACGGDETFRSDAETKLEPTKTTRTVVGRVESFLREPLVGARVSVDLGEGVRSAVVDDEGRFVLRKLPAHAGFVLRVEAEGHTSALRPVSPAWTEEALYDGMVDTIGTIQLLELDGRFEVGIFDSAGQPLTPPGGSCEVDLAWIDLDRDGPMGEMRVEAQIEAGKLICEGLPNLGALAHYDARIRYRFGPTDVDGDGHWDYEGGEATVLATEVYFDQSPRVHQAPRRGESLKIVNSNAPSFRGERIDTRALAPTEAVELLFSDPVVVHHVWVEGMLEKDSPDFEFSYEGDRVRVLPAGGTWPEGQLVRIRLLLAPEKAPYALEEQEGVVWFASTKPLTAKATFIDGDDDGVMGPLDDIRVEFSEVLFGPGSDTFPSLPFQVAFDINGGGLIGDYQGEDGHELYHDALGSIAQRRYENMGDVLIFPEMLGALPLRDGTEIILRFDMAPVFGSSQTPIINEPMRIKLRAVRP